MISFIVGQKLPAPFTFHKSTPTGMDIQTNFIAGMGMVMVIAAPNLTDDEVDAFRNEKYRCKVGTSLPVIFVTVSINGFIGWSDSSFNCKAIAAEDRWSDFTPFPSGTGMALHAILVDSETGNIVAMRQMAVPNAASNHILTMLQRQYDSEYTQHEFDRALISMMGRYDSVALAQYLPIGFVGGGTDNDA